MQLVRILERPNMGATGFWVERKSLPKKRDKEEIVRRMKDAELGGDERP